MEYWGEVANIQSSISYDVMRIIKLAGFNVKGRRLDWMLSINKTDQQRLIDEGIEIENEIMKEQYIQAQVQTMMLLNEAQNPQVDKTPKNNEGTTPKNEKGLGELKEKKVKPSEKDFINSNLFEKIRVQRKQRIHDYMLQLEGKVAS